MAVLWTSEVIKPLSKIKIWLTIIIIYYYFCNQCWSPLKCRSIFIISFGYLDPISKMKWKKICQWLMTLILMVVFLVLSFISLKSLLSRKVGTRLKVENGPKHPDMTFCSFAYNRKYDKLITQINPNNSSNNNR